MKKKGNHGTVIHMSFIAKHKLMTVVLIILTLFVAGGYMAYSNLVVWEDESTVILKESISVSPNPTYADQPTGSTGSKPVPSVVVKGKISVMVKRERGLPFTDAVVVLKSDKGKSIREIQTGSNGGVVFDELVAGTYRVETHRAGDGRVAVKSVTLAEGDIISVDLALYLDTEVKIMVTVKSSDGSLIADKQYTLTKNGGPTLSVTTNGQGVFTATVPPDDNWKLMLSEKEVGSFKVAPSGQSQVINVTTNSN